jgi:lipid II:glycine glycyltransferase (peptidoglycan interpeptide bridge formation enzyme)
MMVGGYGEIIYAIYLCGENGKYQNVYPSVLATWAGLEYGLKNGFKYFDFLGAGKPNEYYGVREFKSKFGGELVNYGRYKLILNKPLYTLGELGIRLIKKYA